MSIMHITSAGQKLKQYRIIKIRLLVYLNQLSRSKIFEQKLTLS